MQEKPKTEAQGEESSENCDDQSSWAEDQQKHEYYYDDAHGYETYAEEDDNEDENDETAEPNSRCSLSQSRAHDL